MTRPLPLRALLPGASAVLVHVVLVLVGYYLLLKAEAGGSARVLSEDWNPGHTCSVTTYAPYLEEDSVGSRLFHLLSASTFFRVHSAQGQLLRSSEWRLWEREFGDLEAPRWISDGHLVYPTTAGYAHWDLPECTGN